MGLKEIFIKQGGMNLLKQYWKNGSFFTAVGEFLLLGKSNTALEILRLSAGLKFKQKLEKKYRNKLKHFDTEYQEKEHKTTNKVWVCWLQGMENAPELVQKCYKSLEKNLAAHEIILITSENMMDYVQFPEYIMEKWKKGIITHTHLTDLLRLELLIQYGGMWVDATVLCTQKCENIPDYYFDSDLFFYQCLKPGKDGHASYISSWLISAKSNNKILMATRHLCYEYWKEHNELLDYFLFHYFLSIVLDYYPKDWARIVPSDNATPHILLLRLFDTFDEKFWNTVTEQIPFHKLSYKFGKEKMNMEDTFYSKIIQEQMLK